MKNLNSLLVGVAAVAGVMSANAQMADPLKPPPAVLAAQTRPAGQDAPPETGPRDAQIIVSGVGRQFVMVGNTAVKPGETYNGARLISVGPEGAVWQREGVREAHGLSPSAKKTVLGEPSAKPLTKPVKKQKKSTTGENS